MTPRFSIEAGVEDWRRQFPALAQRVNARAGCSFAQVLVAAQDWPRALPVRDGVHLKNRFRAALGLLPF